MKYIQNRNEIDTKYIRIRNEIVRKYIYEIQGVLASRGFWGERKNREKLNPRVTRSLLVLKPQNGGKTFPKSTFLAYLQAKNAK